MVGVNAQRQAWASHGFDVGFGAWGAKYLGFFSSHSLKAREKCISFAQLVYFLREVFVLFNFIIQNLKSKHIFLNKYAN